MRKIAMVLAASMMMLVDTAGAAAMPVALDAGNPAELGARRGPGCRAHPDSKWCARHYAQLGQQRSRPQRVARHSVRHGVYSTRTETAYANRQFAPPPGYAPPPPAGYGPPPPPPPPAYGAAGASLRPVGYGAGRFVAALVALSLVALGVAAVSRNDRNDRPTSP